MIGQRLGVIATALLLAACTAGPAATPVPMPVASATPAPTASPPASATPTATALGSPAAATDQPTATAEPTSTSTPERSPSSPAWSELTAAGPAPGPREDHSWTVDDAGATAYLFGGRAGGSDGRQALADLWAYDLASDSWQQLAPAGDRPAARFGHVAAWLDGRGLLVWSGQGRRDFFTDVWLFDPTAGSWSELPASGAVPPSRYGSCGGIGPDGQLWISHGFTADSGRFADTRSYDLATGSWTDSTPAGTLPVNRCLHRCFWLPSGQLLLYAGQTTGVAALGDAWLFEPGVGWRELAPPPPPARQLPALAVTGDSAWIFGGGAIDGSFLGDLWRIDLAEMTWHQQAAVDGTPAARSAGALIADPGRDRLLLFGGLAEGGTLADLWQLRTDDR